MPPLIYRYDSSGHHQLFISARAAPLVASPSGWPREFSIYFMDCIADIGLSRPLGAGQSRAAARD